LFECCGLARLAARATFSAPERLSGKPTIIVHFLKAGNGLRANHVKAPELAAGVKATPH
jgi:hypothetical protein